jgi:hypothetical protein
MRERWIGLHWKLDRFRFWGLRPDEVVVVTVGYSWGDIWGSRIPTESS